MSETFNRFSVVPEIRPEAFRNFILTVWQRPHQASTDSEPQVPQVEGIFAVAKDLIVPLIEPLGIEFPIWEDVIDLPVNFPTIGEGHITKQGSWATYKKEGSAIVGDMGGNILNTLQSVELFTGLIQAIDDGRERLAKQHPPFPIEAGSHADLQQCQILKVRGLFEEALKVYSEDPEIRTMRDLLDNAAESPRPRDTEGPIPKSGTKSSIRFGLAMAELEEQKTKEEKCE